MVEQSVEFHAEQHKNKCPECGSINIVYTKEEGELCCGDCGLVVGEKEFVKYPEWLSCKENAEKMKRSGEPINFSIHDKGLSTFISCDNRDAKGSPLSDGDKYKFQRLRRWNNISILKTGKERTMKKGLEEIHKLSNLMNLPRNVLETASIKYREIVIRDLVKGREIDYLAAASVYCACRQCGLPKRINDMLDYIRFYDTDKKKVEKNFKRTYRFILAKTESKPVLQDSKNYISVISNKLGVYGKTEEFAYKVFDAAREAKLTIGRDPVSIASSSFYIASILTNEKRKKVKQKDIGMALDTTEVTVRNRFKEIEKKLMFIVKL